MVGSIDVGAPTYSIVLLLTLDQTLKKHARFALN